MRALASLPAALAILVLAAPADAATVSLSPRVMMSDSVSLQATLTGAAPLAARPVIVEFSPYGRGSGTTYDGPAYNYLLIQIRGTGDSDGQFDALGPQTQQDVAQTLQWACHQPWSDGRLGLNGFSASAITVYNSLHLNLPCVRTAVLRSGTFDLYRDLLWPGGISNFIPGAGVLALIGTPALEQGGARLQRAPITGFDTAVGLFDAGISAGLSHQSEDSFWQQRAFQGDANRLPILMLDSFFDVESRGAFQAFQTLRGNGAHLLVVGGHDGAPAGTDGGNGATKDWFDHYLLGTANGITATPRVHLLMADGSRESYINGKFLTYDTSNWPVPGTRWLSLWLDSARSGSSGSINDGSLAQTRPAASTTQPYVAIPSEPSSSDVPNTALVGQDGLNQAASQFPLLTESTLGEPQGLAYTTPPLSSSLTSAGPAALDLRVSTTSPETDLWAVISDVAPDGSSHPMATGRLDSNYPGVIRSRSLSDRAGNIVQPYGDYSAKTTTPVATEQSYQIEFWPIGNRFEKGHRIRLVLLGASAASRSTPALNAVRVGGVDGSRLLLPVLPTGAGRCPPASGRVHARALGPFKLGMRRAAVRREFSRFSTRGRRYMDFYCLSPHGIRAGYPSPRLLRTLSAGRRRAVGSRIILLLSANRHYAVRGVRPGMRLAAAAKLLRIGAPFHIGLNYWYLAPDGLAHALLKVRHGVVQEIGIADAGLTRGRRASARFLKSFG